MKVSSCGQGSFCRRDLMNTWKKYYNFFCCTNMVLLEFTKVWAYDKIWIGATTCRCIFTTSILSTLGNGGSPLFKKFQSPSSKRCFVPSFIKSGPKFFVCQCNFIIISFWRSGGPSFSLKTMGAFCQVLLKLASDFWNSSIYFHYSFII